MTRPLAKNTRRHRLFLVESYTPTTEQDAAEAAADRIAAAAASPTAKQAVLRHLATVLVRADETTFYLFEATDPAAVVAVLHCAGIEFEHLAEAELTS